MIRRDDYDAAHAGEQPGAAADDPMDGLRRLWDALLTVPTDEWPAAIAWLRARAKNPPPPPPPPPMPQGEYERARADALPIFRAMGINERRANELMDTAVANGNRERFVSGEAAFYWGIRERTR